MAHWPPRAYSVFSHVATACVLALVAPILGVWLGADASIVTPGHRVLLALFALVWSTGIEFLLATYLLPGVLRQMDGTTQPDLPAFADLQPTTTGSGTPSVALPGKVFALPDLRLISADEHYVHVQTGEGRHMLRGGISDIEAQLPDARGRRVHRSHWVAARSVKHLRRARDAWSLVLDDGTEVPVARARRDALRDRVERLGRA